MLRNAVVKATVLGCATTLLMACGPSPEEFAELKKKQDEILSKLDKEIIPKVDKLAENVGKLAAARPPAAKARPGRPDPTKVYSFPAGDSPAKGPDYAWVTLIEVSDFQ